MIKKIGKILLSLSLLSIINVDKVNALEEKLLSELILGENNKNVIKTAPNFSETSMDKGLYVQEGDETKSIGGKPTYYYRGAVENNYVSFGKKCMGETCTNTPIIWRIVRINEDESIRLISEDPTNLVQFNSNGTSDYTDSTGGALGVVNDFFDLFSTIGKDSNGYDSILASKVVNSFFCNDISGNYTNAVLRFYDINTWTSKWNQSFVCPNGARSLYGKVGMITADEVIYAGVNYIDAEPLNTSNSSYILKENSYWTLTPYNNSKTLIVDSSDKKIIGANVTEQNYSYPVINLDSRVLATGSGTKSDPYVISENLYGETNEEVDNLVKEKQINVKIDSNSKKDKIDKMLKGNPTIYFEIEEDNILPGKITINVSEKYNNNSELWLYKYNKNKVEYVKNEIKVIDGTVKINIDKSGEYFLTLNEIDSSILGEQLGTNLIFIIVFLSTILIGGTYSLIYTCKLQRNRI